MATSPLCNALTIDVEDYFQVSALAPHIPRTEWEARECRVERNIDRILALLDRHGAHGTFFTLGWIAERYPGVVKEIVAAGHELASHGYGHQRVSDLTEDAFLDDVVSAKRILEDIAGVKVQGYRAPSFSIGTGNLWALDVLKRAGYTYSSSIYPIRHDHYGMPEAPRFAHSIRGLVEVPPSTCYLFNRNWPASGGGYFRLLPYALSRWMIQRINQTENKSTVFYFHPWEIDPGQPRIQGVSAKTRFRHYVNLEQMESKLDRLLADFRWERMDRLFMDGATSESTAQ
jgi:polysaccharide deacetylase family protein (PEP-CTERM system associated)